MKYFFFTILAISLYACGVKNKDSEEGTFPEIRIQTKKSISTEEFYHPLTSQNYGYNFSMQKFDELVAMEGNDNIKSELFFTCANADNFFPIIRLACLIEMANKKFVFSVEKKSLIERFFYSKNPIIVSAALWAVVQQPNYLPPLVANDLHNLLFERHDLPRNLRTRIWEIFLNHPNRDQTGLIFRDREDMEISDWNKIATYLPRSASLLWAISPQKNKDALLHLLTN